MASPMNAALIYKWLRSVIFRIAIAIPMQAAGEAQGRFVTKSKSAMTKSIEDVFRRKSTEPCKNHIVEHIRISDEMLSFLESRLRLIYIFRGILVIDAIYKSP
jgi:hypothetical protein